MLNKLEQNNLYLKPEKCDFEQKQIDYLGVIVGNSKLQMDPKKLKGVANWPKPNTPTEIRKFLGFTGYYRYFIQGYSKITQPLLDLTKKAIVWNWGEPQQRAFTKYPFTILTDHANLLYYKTPKKLNRQTAQWHADLQEYDFIIKHVPRKINTPADELSRPPNINQGQNDNEDQTLLKPELFIKNAISTPTEMAKRQLMAL